MIDPALFQHITRNAQPIPSTAGDERRGQPRVALNLRAACSGCDRSGEPTATVIIRELSMTGVGFMATDKMKPGRPFVITLEAGDQGTVVLHGEVVHCNVGGSGGKFFNIGGVFTHDRSSGSRQEDDGPDSKRDSQLTVLTLKSP